MKILQSQVINWKYMGIVINVKLRRVKMRLGALEAGGTKMVCAIGDEKGNIFEKSLFPR